MCFNLMNIKLFTEWKYITPRLGYHILKFVKYAYTLHKARGYRKIS